MTPSARSHPWIFTVKTNGAVITLADREEGREDFHLKHFFFVSQDFLVEQGLGANLNCLNKWQKAFLQCAFSATNTALSRGTSGKSPLCNPV